MKKNKKILLTLLILFLIILSILLIKNIYREFKDQNSLTITYNQAITIIKYQIKNSKLVKSLDNEVVKISTEHNEYIFPNFANESKLIMLAIENFKIISTDEKKTEFVNYLQNKKSFTNELLTITYVDSSILIENETNYSYNAYFSIRQKQGSDDSFTLKVELSEKNLEEIEDFSIDFLDPRLYHKQIDSQKNYHSERDKLVKMSKISLRIIIACLSCILLIVITLLFRKQIKKFRKAKIVSGFDVSIAEIKELITKKRYFESYKKIVNLIQENPEKPILKKLLKQLMKLTNEDPIKASEAQKKYEDIINNLKQNKKIKINSREELEELEDLCRFNKKLKKLMPKILLNNEVEPLDQSIRNKTSDTIDEDNLKLSNNNNAAKSPNDISIGQNEDNSNLLKDNQSEILNELINDTIIYDKDSEKDQSFSKELNINSNPDKIYAKEQSDNNEKYSQLISNSAETIENELTNNRSHLISEFDNNNDKSKFSDNIKLDSTINSSNDIISNEDQSNQNTDISDTKFEINDNFYQQDTPINEYRNSLDNENALDDNILPNSFVSISDETKIVSSTEIKSNIQDIMINNQFHKQENSNPIIEKIDREEILWNDVSNANTYASYSKYLRNYSKGKHIKEALIKQEEALWNECLTKNSIKGFDDYLKKFPGGRYKASSFEKMEDLTWEKTKQMSSLNSYKEFIRKFPNSEYKVAIVEDLKKWLIGKWKKGNESQEFLEEGLYSENSGEKYPWNLVWEKRSHNFVIAIKQENHYKFLIIEIINSRSLQLFDRSKRMKFSKIN